MKILIANLRPEVDSGHSNVTYHKKMSNLHFPGGLGIIAAVLANANFSFDTYDSYVSGTTEGFLDVAQKGCYDVILLSGFLGNYSYQFFKDISHKIKRVMGNTRIIIGGPIATAIPEFIARYTEIDIAVIGEGEVTIIELLNSIKMENRDLDVPGICYKKENGEIYFSAARKRIENLDEFPFPSYDVFAIGKYIDFLKKSGRCLDVLASRGCYGTCRYCCRLFGQKITRYSYTKMVDHMNFVYEEYGLYKFNFVDDNFLNFDKEIDEFVSLLRQNKYEFKWRFQARADRITPSMVKKMRTVGLYDVSLGLESGSPKMLKAYNKKIKVSAVIDNIKKIMDLIDVHATFIVGGPGEDWETISETEDLIRVLELNNAAVGILTLFPKTYLYEKARTDGVIQNEDEYFSELGPVFDRPYTNISDLSDTELMESRHRIETVAREYGEYN